MRKTCLILALSLLAATPCSGQAKGRRRNPVDAAGRAVLTAHRAFVEAVRSGDKRALAGGVAEDFIQTAASGKSGDKAAMVRDTVATPEFHAFNLKVRTYGATAVVNGEYGTAPENILQRFTAVYRLVGRRWLMVAHQQTNITDRS